MDGPGEASGSLLAWSWVIEALASSREVDLDILYGLIKGIPDLCDNLSKEARGTVAFRCLEALCDPAKVSNNGVSLSSVQEEIKDDFSKCCGCVLQASVSRLRKCGSDPFANLSKGVSDKLMREVHALIGRRKVSFPNCALEELRDRLQDGSVFHGTSLKRNASCLQTQKPMQDCSVDDVNGQLPPGKKLRHDSDRPIASTEQNSDPLIFSDTNPLYGPSGKPSQSTGLLAWRPTNVSSNDERRHAEKSSNPADSTELDFCIKCNTGGEVLICSVSSCPIVVHERCLGFSESIDNRDNFLCPFCACSSAQSEYAEAKKKNVLARKRLSLFVGGNPDHQPEGCTNLNANPTRQDRVGKPFKEKGVYPVNQASTDKQQNGNSVRGNIHTSPLNSATCSSTEEGEDVTIEKCQLDKGKQIVAIEHFHYSGLHGVQPLRKISCLSKNASHASSGDLNRTPGNKNHSANPSNNNLSLQSSSKLSDQAKGASCSSSGDLNRTPETKNHSANPSNNYINPQSSPKLSDQTKGAFSASFDEFFGTLEKGNRVAPISTYSPRGRGRVRVPWTEEEVEMLKEGMKRFGEDMKIIPWKTILEFGSSVFSKSRTTVDLKDKWRNLIKANPEQK